jgi:hypothetical protein
MIFYAMIEAETFDPAISTRSLADIKAKGFDSIYLEWEGTRIECRGCRHGVLRRDGDGKVTVWLA